MAKETVYERAKRLAESGKKMTVYEAMNSQQEEKKETIKEKIKFSYARIKVCNEDIFIEFKDLISLEEDKGISEVIAVYIENGKKTRDTIQGFIKRKKEIMD